MLISGADQFSPDLTLVPPRRAIEPEPLPPAQLTMQLQAARRDFQRGLLEWLKGDAAGVTGMQVALTRIEATQIGPAERAPWWVSLAFLDAVSLRGIETDNTIKRIAARIDAQIRKLADDAAPFDQGLMRDLLFHVATSTASNAHIELVRSAYRLDDPRQKSAIGTETESPREQAPGLRDQIADAAQHWARFSGGLAAALLAFHEATARIVAGVEPLGQTDLLRLAAALHNFANLLRRHPLAHDDAMAREVAAALSLLADSVGRCAALDVDFAREVDDVCGRLAVLMRGDSLAAQGKETSGPC